MKQFLLVLIAVVYNLSAYAGNFPHLWAISNEKEISVPGSRKLVPEQYQLVKLNTQDFNLLQQMIPSEESGLTRDLLLPSPDGRFVEFKIFECPVMEKPLADKYPQIKTYTAICKENPHITAKIDFTVFGFHAKVFDGEDTYFIDPYTDLNSDWYLVYYKRDFKKPLSDLMSCHAEEDHQIATEQAILLSDDGLPRVAFKQNGTNKRTYRLALACTMEYSAAVGGATPTKASVLSAMVTTMNRVNGVFEKDFSMHANLVANNDTLIYLPGGTDPYTNNNGATMLGQNQTTVNSRIGSANYDYGHVFSTGGGGIASLGCVCNNSSKAQGVTGSSNPVGDPYDIDYVAHEMGHQFGGSHTFNSVTGSCSGNRSSSSAYEIGSGTTIQAYAGICGTDNIQSNSNDYYHVRSLEQMTGTSVMACATNTPSNNALPTLSPISATYIIPYRTPFELTASGTDVDNDPLLYCWEQWDRGGSGAAWDAVTTVAPIFRSFTPGTSPTRVFPTLKYLLQNLESYKGELLPVNARMLKFRCTLRDLHNGYGAFYTSTDTVKLDVRTTAELFRVTSQDVAGQQFDGYSQQTVTWNVAGTNAAPFTSTNVDIYMSIDSGKTWPYQLANAVPNNGSATVTMPNQNATWCRIKVKGSGNVFFDLNDKWITLKQVSAPAAVHEITESSIALYPNPNQGHFTIELPAGIATADLEIVSIAGTTVYKSAIGRTHHIAVEGLARGFYFAKIRCKGISLIKKFVVE